jgi:hypothetical protein
MLQQAGGRECGAPGAHSRAAAGVSRSECLLAHAGTPVAGVHCSARRSSLQPARCSWTRSQPRSDCSRIWRCQAGSCGAIADSSHSCSRQPSIRRVASCCPCCCCSLAASCHSAARWHCSSCYAPAATDWSGTCSMCTTSSWHASGDSSSGNARRQYGRCSSCWHACGNRTGCGDSCGGSGGSKRSSSAQLCVCSASATGAASCCRTHWSTNSATTTTTAAAAAAAAAGHPAGCHELAQPAPHTAPPVHDAGAAVGKAAATVPRLAAGPPALATAAAVAGKLPCTQQAGYG